MHTLNLSLIRYFLAVVLAPLSVALLFAGETSSPSRPESTTFNVHHALLIKDIAPECKKMRVWFWLPDDDECQKVLDLSIHTSSQTYKITRDPENGHHYLYVELLNPKNPTYEIATDFQIRRNAVRVKLDPLLAGKLTEEHRILFSDYLKPDCPCMEVDDRIAKLADEICDKETNVVTQARRLFDWIEGNTNHYSKDKAPKSSGLGSARYCLDNKGGGCTDQHALFIAMARARGIPTRLQFGSLLRAKNEGKDVDPGYRCWVQYFVPNYGWVPMDISAANTTPEKRDFYFSGLDDHRIRFLEGRNLVLSPKQDGPPVNLMIVAHIELDGKKHTAFDRVLRFKEMASADK